MGGGCFGDARKVALVFLRGKITCSGGDRSNMLFSLNLMLEICSCSNSVYLTNARSLSGDINRHSVGK